MSDKIKLTNVEHFPNGETWVDYEIDLSWMFDWRSFWIGCFVGAVSALISWIV